MGSAERRQSLKDQLLQLDYPWPEYLEDKSLSWLEAEIRAIKPPAARTSRNDDGSSPR
jgi:hypothetical protein